MITLKFTSTVQRDFLAVRWYSPGEREKNQLSFCMVPPLESQTVEVENLDDLHADTTALVETGELIMQRVAA